MDRFTPGVDRVIVLFVNGQEFRFRRPTRADVAETARGLAKRLAAAGYAADVVNLLDGQNLEWEARLEVGLMPATNRQGQVIDLGERAPEHWIESVRDADGREVGRVVSFVQVDPEEFGELVTQLTEALKKKASPAMGSCSTSAIDQING